MKRTFFLALVAASLVAACAQPTPEQKIVNDAADAMGGRDRILAVKTLRIQGGGVNGNLGQDLTPERTAETFTVSDYSRTIDVAAGRMRVEQTRTPTFTFFQGPQAQKQVYGIDGDVGYNVGADGTGTRTPDAAASDRKIELYEHPLTIIRAALDPAAKLTNPHTAGTQRVVDVTTAKGMTFTLAIDGTTSLPTSVTAMTDNTNLGDVAVETTFADYQDVNGLKLPARMTTTTDRVMTVETRATAQTVDGTVGDLAAPAAAASAPAISGPPPINVTVQEVAKGVWFLAGQSHHSVLLEFVDHLTLIEAPLNDARTLAVIAKAREVVPNKPLTTLISTHHHFDHSGGIRAAVSEGLSIIVQKNAAAYYESAAKRPHTIVPDALQKNPKAIKIEPVDDMLELKDASMTVDLYHVINSAHADTMLMAYLPKERLLVEADLWNPGPSAGQFGANLVENVQQRKLKVDKVVPIHAGIGAYADLVKATTPAK